MNEVHFVSRFASRRLVHLALSSCKMVMVEAIATNAINCLESVRKRIVLQRGENDETESSKTLCINDLLVNLAAIEPSPSSRM